ncbi:MAG: hypothetical protein JWQ03_2219, partial [Variovorax sp.]|nr:hypothetical protein [Variovorax sp.]
MNPTHTIELAYVGTKDAEAAFSDRTGIVWRPGSRHAIPADIASRMLQHPDVFARAEDIAVNLGASGQLMANGDVRLNNVLVSGSITATSSIAASIAAGSAGPSVANPEGDPNAVDPSSDNADNPIANRFAGFSDPDDAVTETNAPEGEADGISLSPGGTVASAPTSAPAPAPAPA